jgi:hypothetical protein
VSQRLSSSGTFFYKYVFITLWSGGFGLGTALGFIRSDPQRWLFLVFWLAGTLFLWATWGRLKFVDLWDDKLYVSNLIRDARVPLSEIEAVWQAHWPNIRVIFVRFRVKTRFGRTIFFVPPVRFRLFGDEDPIVAKLRAYAAGDRRP